MSKRLTQEEFEDQVYKKYNNKFSIVGNYINWKTPVKIKCNCCGHTFERTPNQITNKNKIIRCPVCEFKFCANEIVVGKTDLWTTDPDVAMLLDNPEIGYLYKRNSEFKVWVTCPECGHRQFDSIKNHTRRGGFKCKVCGAMSYYPNQFLYAILDLLGVDFIQEYRIDGYHYRYDAYFIKNNNRYLIEMDGGLSHGDIDTPNQSIQAQIETDNNKNSLAKDKGYILIRIDCKYKDIEHRYEYIMNSIKDSELTKIFNIPWYYYEEANKMACASRLKELVKLLNNGVNTYDELKSELHKSYQWIYKNMKLAYNIGILPDYSNYKTVLRNNAALKTGKSHSTPIICNQTGEIYNSITEAINKTGIKTLKDYFSKNNKYAGQLPDGTKLTWSKLERAV